MHLIEAEEKEEVDYGDFELEDEDPMETDNRKVAEQPPAAQQKSQPATDEPGYLSGSTPLTQGIVATELKSFKNQIEQRLNHQVRLWMCWWTTNKGLGWQIM